MHRVIFDTDLGIDDALALLYLLRTPDVSIDAITTVHGNVPVEQATRNVFDVLGVSGASEWPEVAQGSASPLRGDCIDATHVHGTDGLGGWTSGRKQISGSLSAQTASETILQLARERPKQMRLLLLGPATNAALAVRQDPEGFRILKDIVMMAGAVEGPGNVTPVAEFNVYADSQAAREVLQSRVPISMVGLDVTRRAILTDELVTAELSDRVDDRALFLRCVCGQGFSFHAETIGRRSMYLHDPLAGAVLADPTLVESKHMKIDVEVQGELTRGMLVAERRLGNTGGENADFCISVDNERFLRLFCERVLR
ncbi:MAG: nucleoside hydrolase [Acidobacteriota bacterium]|nr:nucleoside hydrolase [Acidobacteriota bacterium]